MTLRAALLPWLLLLLLLVAALRGPPSSLRSPPLGVPTSVGESSPRTGTTVNPPSSNPYLLSSKTVQYHSLPACCPPCRGAVCEIGTYLTAERSHPIPITTRRSVTLAFSFSTKQPKPTSTQETYLPSCPPKQRSYQVAHTHASTFLSLLQSQSLVPPPHSVARPATSPAHTPPSIASRPQANIHTKSTSLSKSASLADCILPRDLPRPLHKPPTMADATNANDELFPIAVLIDELKV